MLIIKEFILTKFYSYLISLINTDIRIIKEFLINTCIKTKY
jgi:hypothetical protein